MIDEGPFQNIVGITPQVSCTGLHPIYFENGEKQTFCFGEDRVTDISAFIGRFPTNSPPLSSCVAIPTFCSTHRFFYVQARVFKFQGWPDGIIGQDSGAAINDALWPSAPYTGPAYDPVGDPCAEGIFYTVFDFGSYWIQRLEWHFESDPDQCTEGWEPPF